MADKPNTKVKKETFHKKIFSWWAKNKKQYPWRETSDPYTIMVSEFMLQQTQASRVIPKFNLFLKKFPDLESLANNTDREVLALWSGLGYNRRAIWLKEAPQYIIELGYFPQENRILKKIRGIGEYTSRSIPIFAFNVDIATVDTNIRRILIHEGFATEETNEKELFKIAEQLLPLHRSRDYHSALMDYGATLITAKKTGIKPKTMKGKFKGSTRESRGKIIKLLLQNEKLSKAELSKKLGKKDIENILNSLAKDQLIDKDSNGKFVIVGSK